MTGEFYTGINEKKAVDFYIAKGIIEEILNNQGYENRYSFVASKIMIKELHPGQTADIIVNRKKYWSYRKNTSRANKRRCICM